MAANLAERLAAHQIIGLDTSIFIYHFEAHSRYLPLTWHILDDVAAGRRNGVVSTVTLMELTVHPWRTGRPDVARHYEALLVNFPNLKLIDVTREIARQAAQLRAKYNVRPADALLVATALLNEATVWVSNDRKLKQVEPEIEVVLLDDYVGA